MSTAIILVCIVTALLVGLLTAAARRKRSRNRLPLPPGPPGLPVVTLLVALGRSVFNVEEALRRLRHRYGPVISLPIFSLSRPAIFFLDRGVAYQALVTSGATFASRPDGGALAVLSAGCRNITSAPYGALWRTLRRNLIAELLHPSRLPAFVPARRRLADDLVTHLVVQSETSSDGGVTVKESFQHVLFRFIVSLCFGDHVDDGTAKKVELMQRETQRELIGFQVFALLPAVTKLLFFRRWQRVLYTRRRRAELFQPLIRARASGRSSAGDRCYVDSLLDLRVPEDGGRALTEDEMHCLCAELMTAGTDTTATALEWTMANLVKNPTLQRRLREEVDAVAAAGGDGAGFREEDLARMKFVKAVVLESLRRHPPVHFVLPHEATAEDATFGGHRIPKGSPVNVMLTEMGCWDEELWRAPMEFLPERFLPGGEGDGVDITCSGGVREVRMMPFGAGRRMCPAVGLAVAQLEFVVANLVRELEWEEIPGEPVDMAEKFELTVVMRRPLRARIVPRRVRANDRH